MSESIEAIEVPAPKVPKGSKRCPGCTGFVKGPRTLTCPACGYAFGTKKPTKVVAKTIVVVPPRESPDPYTFSVNAVGDYNSTKGASVVRRAMGNSLFPKGLASTLEYLTKVSEPEWVETPNFIVVA